MAPRTARAKLTAVTYDQRERRLDRLVDELKAVTYGRNSTANQISIDSQDVENAKACKELSARVVAALSDPISASRYATKARENWAKLLDLVPTVDLIVLWEPSRGDRTLSSWAAFLDLCREHGTRIHATSHNRTYDPRNARDYRSLAEDGVDSVYESDKISARVRRGKAAAYAAGRPAGKLDYGYTRVFDTSVPPKYLRQDPHPQQSKVVQRIFAAFEAGETSYRIAAALNRDGVPTFRGAAAWRPNVVQGVATNPLYRPHPDDPERGTLARVGETWVGTWPPLVTEATWQAVQRILGTEDADVRRHRRTNPPGQIKYLLSSSTQLLTAPCGSRLNGQAGRAGRTAHYLCAQDGCVSATMAEADDYVSQLVVARLSKKDARDIWVADSGVAKAAKDELARLRAELAANERAYARHEISAKLAGARERELEPQIADAERRSQPTGAPLAALKLMEAARLGKAKVRPMWDSFPVTAQREVIAGIFESLVLGPVTERITRWTTEEERLAIVADRITHNWRRRT